MSILWFYLCGFFFLKIVQAMREKIQTQNFIKMKRFEVPKDITKKVKRQHIEWEKRCENYLYNKGLASKIYKELLHQ